MESEVQEFVGESDLDKVIIKSKVDGSIQEIPAKGTFIFIGYVPKTDPFKDMIDLSKYGEIIVDKDLRTSLKGVYAVGDAITKKVRQITTAVSDGTIAALTVMEDMNN